MTQDQGEQAGDIGIERNSKRRAAVAWEIQSMYWRTCLFKERTPPPRRNEKF